MCERCNLRKMVALVDQELDRTMDVGAAVQQLQIIRARMVKVDENPQAIFDLTQIMATMQPYLIWPDFMAGDKQH